MDPLTPALRRVYCTAWPAFRALLKDYPGLSAPYFASVPDWSCPLKVDT